MISNGADVIREKSGWQLGKRFRNLRVMLELMVRRLNTTTVKGNGEDGLLIRIPRGEGIYAVVIEAHTAPAYRYRFCSNFGKSYCIVAAMTEPDADGVLLIKIDWENGFGGKAED